MSILATLVLPRIINLSKDARVASITSMRGAINTEMQLAYAKCTAMSTCDVSANQLFIYLDSVYFWLSYGFPAAGDMLGNGQIDAVINYNKSNIAVKEINHFTTLFYIPDAEIPDSCSVSYTDATSSPTKTPKIVLTTSGC